MGDSEANWEERRAERVHELAETSGTSLMGKVLRRFWHPIALSSSVAVGKARAVRALAEDLTLYRGESGRAYLVGGRCAHRLTLLHTGWVEGERIRCMYHGWQYDGMGICVHRPAEKDAGPGIRIDGYPVHEYCGVIFAYMGEGEPPVFDLWRKPSFEKPNMLIFPRKEIWPCNWLQNVENSIDSVHVSFTHQMGRIGAFGEAITSEIPELSFRETEAGICQIAVRAKNQVRISDWTFPYCNHVSLPGLTPQAPWLEIAHWMVPVDDGQTMRLAVFASPSSTPQADERLKEYFEGCADYNAADHHEELFAGRYPSDPLVRLTSAQDYVVLTGQGTIANRAHERLGYSDGGVTLLRRILRRELEAVRTGGSLKEWRRLQQPSKLFEDSAQAKEIKRT